MFIYKDWDSFCRELSKISVFNNTVFHTLNSKPTHQFVILKHDVETNPKKALALAKIENKYLLKGTFYVQAYLLKHGGNIKILKRIQELGHEVSYHHDVMDSNNGNIELAERDFRKNIEKFTQSGFHVQTVCQHGNPILQRKGYSSNRDFFRNREISTKYQDITEVMVNFRQRLGQDFKYISDAGYGWKIIYDQENNDRVKSDEKNIKIDSLEGILDLINQGHSVVISTHPHRWNDSIYLAKIRSQVFSGLRITVKHVVKIPPIGKLAERYYYLAKKI